MSDKPVNKITIGAVSATVWKNNGNDRSFYSVDLQRRYKDSEGEWQNTASLGHADILNAARVLTRAEAWIADQ